MESQILDRRVEEFNSSLKLGIDVGLETGGIALVQDGKILFAKTLVDFHENSLEKRRELRRARRTRRTKEMRLARLRSWVLRQKVNGKQLPDPYKILKDPKLWVKFSEYKAHTKKPLHRIDAVISGQDTTPEGFVRALTLIFQKRGYRSQNEKFLPSIDFKSKIKNLEYPITEDYKNELLDEVSKRFNDGEFDERAYSNFNKKINEIYDKSKNANATDRKLIEDKLKKVINTFCSANGIAGRGELWYKQLLHILNKRLRKVRFDNRILINCSICGIHTPLKKNVRTEEFELALKNLKSGNGAVDYIDGLKRIFSEIENYRKGTDMDVKLIRKKFFALYKKDKLDENMKQQIEVLIFEPLYGRSRYCRKHLREQLNGTLKLDYGKLSPRFTINPGFKNHDDRVIAYLKRLLFEDKIIDPSKIRYISIEAPQPKTKRARPGESTKRNEEKIKDRLKKEFGGIDIYSGDKLEKNFEIDHIFPVAYGGPYLQENYVPCNKSSNRDKKDRTPYEWLSPVPEKFAAFESRVLKLYSKEEISERKKNILLNKEKEYPGENPTTLSRVSGNIGYFVDSLQKMFEEKGLPKPEPTESKTGILIQVTPGWLTEKLRWQWNAVDTKLIPKKDVGNSFNHAEDAALIASIPPASWRNRIFRYTLKNFVPEKGPNKDKKIDRPGMAIPNLAPHWNDFLNANEGPMVKILGKNRVSWHNRFMDLTYGLNPDNLEAKKQSIHTKTETIKNGQKRRIIKRNKGGLLAGLKPSDGPIRQVTIKPSSNYIILYKNSKNKVDFIHGFINPIVKLYNEKKIKLPEKEMEEIEMLINVNKKNSKILRLYNHQIIKLHKNGKWPAGHYMISELGKNGIYVIPEDKIKTIGEKVKSKNSGKVYSKKKGKVLKKEELDRLYNEMAA